MWPCVVSSGGIIPPAPPSRSACGAGTLTGSTGLVEDGRRVPQQRAGDDGVGPARRVALAPGRATLASGLARGVPRSVGRRGRPRRADDALQSLVPAGPVGGDRRPARAGAQGSALGPRRRHARARGRRLLGRRRARAGARAARRPGARGAQRRRAGRRAAAADPAARDAAAVHRLGRHRRGLEGRLHHLRDVLSDVRDHRARRRPDRRPAAARGTEPGRAAAPPVLPRDPARRAARRADRAAPGRGALVLRHRHLGVRRRRERARVSHQRLAQLLPGAADARRRAAARPPRLRRQRAGARAGAARAALAAPALTMKIRVRGLSRTFVAQGRETPALLDVDLEVAAHEFVCLLGPSGCGKSTLLNIVAGFLRPTAGEVRVDERPVTGPGADRGVVFQEYVLFPWLTVAGNVEFGLKLKGAPVAERRGIVARYLELVGLAAHAEKYPVQLSGGMKQRVAIARALANSPEIILMDEPFGALDAQTREVLQDELGRIQRVEHKTVLFVTHSIREAVYLADRVIVMTSAPGRIKQVFTIKLPEVRDRFAPEFTHYESEITRVVKEEVAKVHE